MSRGTWAPDPGWAVACALVLLWAPVADAQGLLSVLRNLPDRIPFPVDVARSKSAFTTRAEKIDPLLLALSDDVAAKGPSSLQTSARALQVSVRDDLVAVKLIAEDAAGREELEWRVEDEGGVVAATLENVVLANLPLDRIEAFEDDADLYYMTAQTQFSHAPPDAGAASRLQVGAGVRAIGVERLHAAGVTGRGVKVGILDFGFQGYETLVRRGALPRAAARRAFNRSQRMENGQVHGTACAEIVHAVAPDAELYLAAVGENGSAPTAQIVQAAEWLADQDLDVISFSGGGHGGPHDGTDLLDRLVDRIVERTGVLWVNAAGNEGARHWGGSAADRDGDLVVELDGSRRGFAVRPSGGKVEVLVNWDDWGPNAMQPAATQDIDAFLFEVGAGGRLSLVAQSIRPQRGRGPPVEQILYDQARAGREYVVVLRATRLDRPVRLHAYNLAGGTMQPVSASGSIGIPATARGALAVGAVDVGSGRLESFSSQGPTDDGRTKPEVSAPDKTHSLAYRGAFPGTSAAAPHVSGFAALLKQIDPAVGGKELSQMVMRHVRPIGGRTPNNEYGHGHIDGTDVMTTRITDVSTVVLPRFLGGRTSARTLDALWERGGRGPRFGLRVRVNQRPGPDGEPPRYRIGDPMKVGFATDERCRYALMLRDARGDYQVMSSGEIEPGERRLLPEEAGESWTIGHPLGAEGFLLVCARREVDLDASGGNSAARDDVDVAIAQYRVVR